MIRTKPYANNLAKSVCPGCLYRYECTWHANEPKNHPITSCKLLKPYDWKDAEREAEYKNSQREIAKRLR